MPNWTLTDCGLVDSAFKALVVPPPPLLPTSVSLRTWFDTPLNKISALLALHTPLKRITHQSKPWWSTSLSMLRNTYNSPLRPFMRDHFDTSLLASARAALYSYFKAIKKPKRDYMSSFLATTTPQTVWMAKRFAIGRPPPPRFPELPGASSPLELNKALLDYFFLGAQLAPMASILLPCQECPELAASEIERALTRSSPSLAPSPDTVPNLVWKKINKTAPQLILSLLSPLVSYGFHPPSLKRADRIVLDKPGKPSYHSSS